MKARLLIALCAVVLALVVNQARAEVQLTASYAMPSGAEFAPAPQYSIRAGGEYYLFASYSKHEQITISQRMGHVGLITGGIGLKHDFGQIRIYGEAGMGWLDTDYKDRVATEVAHYLFNSNFGQPPFGQNWWTELEQTYQPDQLSPSFRLGAQYELTDTIRLDVSYLHYATDVYYATWNPGLNGGPVEGNFDACGCLWEGTGKLSLSGLSVGLSYSF